jgi:DNA-binding beta-propeller fold protein YncE
VPQTQSQPKGFRRRFFSAVEFHQEKKQPVNRSIRIALLAMATTCLMAARPPATVEVPKFVVDPTWPKIPNGWTFGQVASTAADADGNIWVLQRPKTAKPGVQTGPPVLEFDQAGNYVRGWGGPGEGYDWPQSEHGIFVDYKGFVWIGGNGPEDQILKFTKDGKFVMQLGHGGHKKTNQDTENFSMPADVFVYRKTNELFVADGYGNKRIIVFDADTGTYKRMWGAFGNVPSDAPNPTPEGEEPRVARGGRERGNAGEGGSEDPNRILATQFDPKDPGPAQFSTVHGVKVSNDGLVYVADRGGKRLQVFTIDGKYVSQVWIDRWCLAAGNGCGTGETAASVAFSADPAQRFLYVASRSPARIWILDRKTLQPLDSFGRPGIAPGEFDVLHHMTTDSKGNIYTAEAQDGRRIQKFTFKGLVSIPAN